VEEVDENLKSKCLRRNISYNLITDAPHEGIAENYLGLFVYIISFLLDIFGTGCYTSTTITTTVVIIIFVTEITYSLTFS
jgi:hypothetical protein